MRDKLPCENPQFLAWLETRNPEVRALAQEFPPGTAFELAGVRHWVIGYNEDATQVILTPINPFNDYEGATQIQLPLPAARLRQTVTRQ